MVAVANLMTLSIHPRIAFFLAILCVPLLSQTASTTPKSSSNAHLQALVDEDQRVRVGPPLAPEEHARITRTDADRLAAVKKIIAANQLVTSTDFRNAAILLQHGSTSNDYLLSHTLAVIAASKGDKTSVWLSAASLDRYLISIKQPQIYGTQYNHFDPTKPWTQMPYNSDLISDAIRNEFGVPTLKEQKKEIDIDNSPPAAK